VDEVLPASDRSTGLEAERSGRSARNARSLGLPALLVQSSTVGSSGFGLPFGVGPSPRGPRGRVDGHVAGGLDSCV